VPVCKSMCLCTSKRLALLARWLAGWTADCWPDEWIGDRVHERGWTDWPWLAQIFPFIKKMGFAKSLYAFKFVRKRSCTKSFSSCLHVPLPILNFPLPFRLLRSHLPLPETPQPVHKFTKRANHARSL